MGNGLTSDTGAQVRRLLAYAATLGLPAKIVSAVRPCEEQEKLFAQGRTSSGPVVTWVNGCRSWHVHGRAVDLYVGTWDPDAYKELGRFWEQLGGRWGGRFGDYGHFEWHPGLTIEDVCPDPSGACKTGFSLATMGKGLAVAGLAGLAYLLWSRR